MSWILPSYLDADKMAAQVVPLQSTVTVDQRRVGGRKIEKRFAAEFAIFIALGFCSFILFLFPDRITHIIGETCFC